MTGNRLKEVPENLINRIFKKPRRRTHLVSSLKEVNELADRLAKHFPQPVKAKIGLTELLTNALEHGNLGITSKEKSQLLQAGKYYQHLEKCIKATPRQKLALQLEVFKNQTETRISIKDQGQGFDYKNHQEQQNLQPAISGQGIKIARELCFDQINYTEGGTKVTVCSFKTDKI
ncbi:ATP-binding protein [Marinospirillum perlucidum]|uniref:ATP-binding protein n=1 Tax=Marinospirillum perlucidum TaxID=1982602 RepID=UPI000DF2D758|nr:ATP-binding protein [Marinospirillum perlucidum]